MLERVPNEEGKSGHVKYLCRCVCGNEVIVSANNLTSGNTKSCGCKKKELFSLSARSDLTGRRFGRLLVLERDTDIIRGNRTRSRWKCLCDCGATTTVCQDGLIRESTMSCGCYQRELSSARYTKDLTGQTFGYLTVVDRDGGLYGDSPAWRCKCVCGNTVTVRGQSLKKGLTLSCGCKKLSARES